MNLKERAGNAIAVASNGRPAATALVITPESVHLRRRLGPLAWMVLEHLALSCRRMEGGGWAAAVGVRDIASGVGVTKDTAARAVSALLGAGLVTRELIDSDAKRRPGYQLHLPAEMRLIGCPEHTDRTDRGGSARPNRDWRGRLWHGPGHLEKEDTQEGTRAAGPAREPGAFQPASGIPPGLFDDARAGQGEPMSPLTELTAPSEP